MFGKKLFRQQKSTRIRQVTTPVAPHGIVLNPILASTINQLSVNAEWLSKLSVAAPLGMLTNPTGTHIYLQRQTPFLAKLSGSSSPYSWQEVYSSAPGTISVLSGGRSGTSNAYELNSKASLNNAIVELTAMGGWYAFQWVGFAPPTISWTFNVRGCVNVGIAGATVELYQSGVLIDSCVTADGTGGTTLGRCVLSVPAGTYDVVVTGPMGAGFAVNTTSQSITTTKTTTISLLADSDHVCTCCNLPIPKVLHSTDADGAIALTYTGSGAVWESVSTTPVSITCLPTGSASEPCINCESPSTALKRYVLSFQLIAGVCVARLQIYSGAICCENQTYLGNGDPPGTLLVLVSSNVTCDPLSVSFSVPTTVTTGGCASTGTPGGGGAMEFTP